MELPLELLRTIDVIVSTGSLEDAAAELSITPSAVSQRLKALETRVGRVLVVRSKPVRATADGQVLIRLARQLATLEHDTLASLGLGEDGPVEVPLAVNADSLATWFLPALAPLATDIVFDLHRDDQDYTVGLLESGTVTAAVTSQAQPVAGCSVRPLGAMRYLPVAAPGFYQRWFEGTPAVEAFGRAPAIDFDRRDDLQTRYLITRGVDPALPPRHHVPASHDFASAVLLGMGWALIPEQQSRPALADGRLVGLGGAPVDVQLYWQRWKLASELLTRIEDAVVSAARSALRQ
ncbi:MAG TPA: LysR family transcriptional regulator ArgP [Propionicimonas sp.]|nr:LysR family transcriptional regulator ArgP [Propionicimonas sp.]HQA78331.1 LysR family transcriptional regulator ArgP [Propionicimonas sp.]HQD96715.1 LysR family transcriptional regulator ArgP [Propionicimonas sp.]